MTEVGKIVQLTSDDNKRITAALIASSKLAGVMIPIEEVRKLNDWLREPDYVERASLDWLVDWMNRRPSLQAYVNG